MVGLFRTLLIILIFYYGFKILARLLAPFFLNKVAKNMQRRAEEQQQRQANPVKEGETVIDRKPSQQNISNKKVGEYVDFEEIE